MSEVPRTERYELLDRIATGGMGEVWHARDTLLHREVALKLLKAEYADDPSFRERFATEARNAAALHDRHIATVFDVGEHEADGGPTPYLVMEYVDGRPLSELIRPGQPMPPETARDLVGQAADGLAVAHGRGIVHRDVKPANLMVSKAGTVKITDFGIARAADGVALTQTGQIVGTPHYLAPEQAEGRSATPASDVYSLGVVLHECLTGVRPFSADTPVATALAHLRQDPPPLPDSVPADLRATTMRALAKDPAERYPDAAAFAAALRGATDEGTRVMPGGAPIAGAAAAGAAGGVAAGAGAAAATSVLSPTSAGAAPADTSAGSVPPLAPTPRERARRRRRPPAWVLAALAVPLIVLLAVLFVEAADRSGTTADDTATAPSTAAEPTPTPTPTPTPSETAAPTAVIDAEELVGEDRDKALGILEDDLGFTDVTVTERDNPEGEDEGTVVDVTPTGEQELDAPIELVVWGPEPEEEPAAPEEKEDKGPGKGKGKKP